MDFFSLSFSNRKIFNYNKIKILNKFYLPIKFSLFEIIYLKLKKSKKFKRFNNKSLLLKSLNNNFILFKNLVDYWNFKSIQKYNKNYKINLFYK